MLRGHGKLSTGFGSALLGGALILSLGGCLREDENTLAVFGTDDAIIVAPLTLPAFLLPPSGSAVANRLELISFDASPPDAFGRATTAFGLGWDADDNYLFDDQARNVTSDPRLPALGGTGTEDILAARKGVSGCRMGEGTWWGGTGGWDFFCFLEGLKPNTDYSALIYRYATVINGDLDTSEMLINGSIAAPDELVPLGGSPGGYPTELCDFDPGRPTFTIGVTGNQNPLNMGFVTTDAAGELVFDCLVGSGGFWADEELTDPAESPMAPNTFTSFDLPKYNYIVIVEGTGTAADPIPTGPPVMRFQVGVDLDMNGDPIGNGFAPLPTAGLDPFQLAEADFAESRPDSVVLRLNSMAGLSSPAVYQAYALLDGGTASGPLDFVYSNVVELPTGDSVVVPPEVRSDLAGGDNTHVLTLEHPDDATYLFIAVQSAAGGQPSEAQPLWVAGGIQPAGVRKAKNLGSLTFGTFALNGAAQRLWAISGVGRGGLFGDEFRVSYEHLPRPPVGYRYAAWLVSEDMTFQRLPDETFTSPPPEYAMLESADTDPTISDVVQPLDIVRAMTRFCLTGTSPIAPSCVGPFDLAGFETFVLTLEPRAIASGEPAPTRVLEGLVPSR